MDTRTTNHYSATYDPADNKLRMYSTSRLDAETYARVKDAGFAWAPKQGFFVAPMWTPHREDLLIELCGEIGDEDTTLVDRAEERADRFGDYQQKRAADGDRAHQGVKAITSGIPFGQPILVGHHSERRARRDVERIDNGMRRAVQMWETSEYWKWRAAGALAHEKYKERADVRARRIKKLEADKRKQERTKAEAEKFLAAWSREGITHDEALRIANYCWLHLPAKEGDTGSHRPTAYDALEGRNPTLYVPRTLVEVIEAAKTAYPATIAHCDRWINHYDNRITYERAMLDEQGGLKAEGYDLQPGGRVLVRGEWATVIRVNRKEGRAVSVSTNCRYVSVRPVEEIQGYEPPTAEAAAAVKAATTPAPLCNFPGEGVRTITKAQWDRAPKDYKGTNTIKATETTGAHRVRTMLGVWCKVEGDTDNQRHHYHAVYISDAKRVDPPTKTPAPVAADASLPVPERVAPAAPVVRPVSETAAKLEATRAQLRACGQVVTAPQLFPTPVALAERMADLADIQPGDRAADFSAGTGRLLAAIAPRLSADAGGELVAVEIVLALADMLRRQFPVARVECGDFLALTDSLGLFDVILLNPPYADAADIKHIQAAMGLLKPRGRLVALCAGGPRQHDALRPLVEARGGLWEPLPAGTFLESGTGVNAVLLAITA